MMKNKKFFRTQIFRGSRRLDEIFYCAALKNEIRQLNVSKMSDFVIGATLDKLIQPTCAPYAFRIKHES